MKKNLTLSLMGALVALGSACFAEKEAAHAEGLVFKPVVIEPSPDGHGYDGIFLMENRSNALIRIPISEEPIGDMIRPAHSHVRFQTKEKEKEKWNYVENLSGALTLHHSLKPGQKCKMFVDIFLLEEPPHPVLVRLGFADQSIWSEPFTLNWKRDRDEGRFLKARANHVEKLRGAFTQAGFKE